MFIKNGTIFADRPGEFLSDKFRVDGLISMVLSFRAFYLVSPFNLCLVTEYSRGNLSLSRSEREEISFFPTCVRFFLTLSRPFSFSPSFILLSFSLSLSIFLPPLRSFSLFLFSPLFASFAHSYVFLSFTLILSLFIFLFRLLFFLF